MEDIGEVATGTGYRITAWLKLIFKCPYKIGQSVIIACVEGDVVEMTLAHVMHSKVGRTVAGEDGRDAVCCFQMLSCSVKRAPIIRLKWNIS